MQRDIYQQGQISLNYLILAITIVGMIAGVLALLGAEKFELSRIKKLIQAVKNIGTNGNISERVLITGKDEISSLAKSINNMLGLLYQSENKLRDSEQYYRSIFETTGAALAISDKNNLLFLVNSEFEKLSGYSREELEGKKGGQNSSNPAILRIR